MELENLFNDDVLETSPRLPQPSTSQLAWQIQMLLTSYYHAYKWLFNFFVRGAAHVKFLDFINHCILHKFDMLPKHTKLDFLRVLAEISVHATTEVASQMIPPTVKLLKEYMSKKNLKTTSSTYFECLLYLLHQLACKTPDATHLCDIFKSRLKQVNVVIRARMVELAQILDEDDIAILDTEKDNKTNQFLMENKLLVETRRENTKTEMRSCNNIIAMAKVLLAKKCSFIGDNSVKLSWKAAKKSLFSDLSDDLVPRAPERPEELKSLPTDWGYCHLNDVQAQFLVGLTKFQQVHDKREGQFALHDRENIAMLSWRIKESELPSLQEFKKKGRSGKVRNQMYHLLCWAYVASDLVSGLRYSHGLEEEFHFLCTWYICSFCQPEKLGKDERSKMPDNDGRQHHCYGSSVEIALRHIQTNGIPREIVENFLCTDHHPPSADEHWMERRTIKKVRRLNTLKDALEELKNQPIGADLIHYTGLFVPGEYIYYGPRQRGSSFVGYHAVVIEDVKKLHGEFVAVCKLSNGYDVADNGYAYVSLATQYMPVGVSKEQQHKIRGSHEPMHLLTNFFIPEMDKKVDDGVKVVKKEDKEEDEEKPQKENEEEQSDYIPKHKRPKTSKSGRFRVPTCSPDSAKFQCRNLEISDEDFKEDLSAEICSIVEKFSPEKIWYIDQMLKALWLSTHDVRRIKDIIGKQKESQRAIEFNSIVDRGKRPANESPNNVGRVQESPV